MKKILLAFIVVISIVLLEGCSFMDDIDETIEDSTKPKVTCEVEKQYKDRYGYSYYIEGTCTNNGTKDYDYIQVECICYDKEGNNLGTAIDNMNNLLENQKWKFKATAFVDDVKKIDHCDFYEVTGW